MDVVTMIGLMLKANKVQFSVIHSEYSSEDEVYLNMAWYNDNGDKIEIRESGLFVDAVTNAYERFTRFNTKLPEFAPVMIEHYDRTPSEEDDEIPF